MEAWLFICSQVGLFWIKRRGKVQKYLFCTCVVLFMSRVSDPGPRGPPSCVFNPILGSNALDSLIKRPLPVLQKPESGETCRMSDLRGPGLDLAGWGRCGCIVFSFLVVRAFVCLMINNRLSVSFWWAGLQKPGLRVRLAVRSLLCAPFFCDFFLLLSSN